MFQIKKEVTISCSHFLKNHEKCGKMHGHNYRIIVTCQVKELSIPDAMVVDFGEIKKTITRLDHSCLNDHLGDHPTAEHLSQYIAERINDCVRVDVWETDTAVASWIGASCAEE